MNVLLQQAADEKVPAHVEAIRKFVLSRLEAADETSKALDTLAIVAALEHVAAVMEQGRAELKEYAIRWRSLS